MINIFHDDEYITLCNFFWPQHESVDGFTCTTHFDSKMTFFRSRLTPSITGNARFLEEDVVLSGYHVPANVSIGVFIPILLLSFF